MTQRAKDTNHYGHKQEKPSAHVHVVGATSGRQRVKRRLRVQPSQIMTLAVVEPVDARRDKDTALCNQ